MTDRYRVDPNNPREGDYYVLADNTRLAYFGGQWRRMGVRSAGHEWVEPWCEDHSDGDGQNCMACTGASHDAWMHRAKTAEGLLGEAGGLLAEARHMAHSSEEHEKYDAHVQDVLGAINNHLG